MGAPAQAPWASLYSRAARHRSLWQASALVLSAKQIIANYKVNPV